MFPTFPTCRHAPTVVFLAVAAAVGAAAAPSTDSSLSEVLHSPGEVSPTGAGFLAARRSLATAADDDDDIDTDDVHKLRLRLQEERNRAEIADVAAVAALQNATLQAQRRKEAEAKLAQVAPSLGDAQRRAEEEQKRVEALQEELKQAEAKEARQNASTPASGPKAHHHGKILPSPDKESYPLDGLRNCPGQVVFAGVSVLLALLSILDAVGFLKVSIVLLAAGLAASIAAWEAEQQWGEEARVLAAGMAVEASIIAGFSALLGIEGLLPSLAALLASMLAARLLALVGDGTVGVLGQIIWYGLWCLLGATGVVLADFLRRHEARALCGALLGGIFAGSGVSCFLATLFGAAGSWWDYFEALLMPAIAQGESFNGFCLDVGVLSGLAVAAASFLRFWLREPSTDPKYPFPELLELLGLPTGPQPPKRPHQEQHLQQPLLRNVPELPKVTSTASSSSSTSGLRPGARAEPLPSIPSQGSSPATAVASQATTMVSRKSSSPATMLSGFLKGLVRTLKKAVSTKPPKPNVRLPVTSRNSRSSSRG